MKKKMIVAVLTAAALVVISAFSAFAAEPAPGAQGGQNVSSIEDLTVSELGTINGTDNRAEHDTGHIYLGADIIDGQVQEGYSNWADKVTEEDGALTVTMNDDVAGEGFTAVRAKGDSVVTVTGDLYIHDEGDGTYDSDFTGMGSAVATVDGATVYAKNMNFLSEGVVRSFGNLSGAKMIVEDSYLTAMGANPFTTFYDEYCNTADTAVMISPPWVLGIQGAVRVINLLGQNSTLVVADSDVTSGGWAVLVAALLFLVPAKS